MTEKIEQILLIDLENCQGHVEWLMDDLQQFSRVILCYARTYARINAKTYAKTNAKNTVGLA